MDRGQLGAVPRSRADLRGGSERHRREHCGFAERRQRRTGHPGDLRRWRGHAVHPDHRRPRRTLGGHAHMRSVKSKARSRLCLVLLATALGSATSSGCALFGASRESTVAQGKYYASGNAYYDQFFVDLYMLQVGMAEAPKTPEAERQRWVQLLQLDTRATPAMLEQRLHEEALSLSRAGVHLRLDQASLDSGPDVAYAAIRSNARPKEDPPATLLATVETSSTNLLRCQLTMKQKEAALSRLELMAIRLDAGVDRTFSQAPVGKPEEVKHNLADARKLMPLMRARAEAVRGSTEQLLAALTH